MMKKRLILHWAMGVLMTPLLGSCTADELFGGEGEGNHALSFEVGVVQLHDAQGWTRSSAPQMRPMHSLELTSANGDTIYARSQSLGIIHEHSHVSAVTRAAAKTTDAFYDSFGVIAFKYPSKSSWDEEKASTTPSLYNAKATQSDGKWVVGGSNGWLEASQKLSFFAYAPYSDENTGIALSDKDHPGAPTITYTVPQSFAAQSDLLVAKALDHDASGTTSPTLAFSHALCGVKFAVGSMSGITKITKIVLSGVSNKGTLEIGGSSWSLDNSSRGSYTIEKAITVSNISNQDITGDGDLLFLMPQKVPSGATLTITADGQEYTASIAGESWAMGAMVTYKLSISKITGSFEFSVTPSQATISKNGENITFTVTSYIEYTSNNQTLKKAVPWTSEIKDINGNYLSYRGTETTTTTTEVKIEANIAPTINHKAKLQERQIGTSDNYHDLSYDYDSNNRWTANCYVVNGWGYFKLPLVYGNAIEKGVANTAAYKADTKSPNTAKDFCDRNGAAISDPWITELSGTINKAKIEWQYVNNLKTTQMVKNAEVGSETDGHYYLFFKIDKDAIDQGNALISVSDGGGILWSWHIWVTDMDWKTTHTYKDGTYSYRFMKMPLGMVDLSPTYTAADPRPLNYTFKQTPSNGKSEVVLIQQAGDPNPTNTICTFYQWGRKDPFKPETIKGQSGGIAYKMAIMNPTVFYKPTGVSAGKLDWSDGHSYQLWNSSTVINYTSIKTIYDPCPPGFKVPPLYAYQVMKDDSGVFKWTSSYAGSGTSSGRMFTNTSDYWQAFGRLYYCNFQDDNTGAYYWSADIYDKDQGYCLSFSPSNIIPKDRLYRADGLSVRPVTEE